MSEILVPQIPEPKETGSSGTQLTGVGEIVSFAKESPLEGLPIIQRLEGLVAAKSRCLGGEVSTSLIVGSFAQLSYELQIARRDLHDTRDELKRTLEEMSAVKIKAAVLQERVNAYLRERHLKNLSITAGTVMIGIGIDLYRNNFDYYYIVGGLGALLLILGWFSKSKEAEK